MKSVTGAYGTLCKASPSPRRVPPRAIPYPTRAVQLTLHPHHPLYTTAFLTLSLPSLPSAPLSVQLYIFSLFLAFSWSQTSPALFHSFGFVHQLPNGSPAAVLVGLTLFTSSVWTPVDKLLSFLVNMNSRANEFAADRYAAELGMGSELSSGLVKISIGGNPPYSRFLLYQNTLVY